MKYFYFLLFVITFMAGQTLGQQLAPAEAGGGGFWPLVIIALVGLVGVGLYLWHKRNPSQADAAIHGALTTANNDVSELARKVGDAVGTLAKTNRELGMVVSSPPVQAAINVGAPPATVQTPPQPAPIAPQATIAPEMAPTLVRAGVYSPQPLVGATMSALPDWRNYHFPTPATAEQIEFNRLQDQIGPGAAYFFVEESQAVRTDLETAWGVVNGSPELKDFYRRLLNQFANEGNPLGLSAIEIKTFARQERAYILSKFK